MLYAIRRTVFTVKLSQWPNYQILLQNYITPYQSDRWQLANRDGIDTLYNFNLQYMVIIYWCYSRRGVYCFTVDSISETKQLITLGVCVYRRESPSQAK